MTLCVGSVGSVFPLRVTREKYCKLFYKLLSPVTVSYCHVTVRDLVLLVLFRLLAWIFVGSKRTLTDRNCRTGLLNSVSIAEIAWSLSFDAKFIQTKANKAHKNLHERIYFQKNNYLQRFRSCAILEIRSCHKELS